MVMAPMPAPRTTKKMNPLFANSLAIAVRIAAITTCIIVASYMSDSPGINDIFSWHPIFMSVGFVVVMTEGLLSYVDVAPGESDRKVRRSRHGLIQTIAALFVLAGYACIFSAHAKKGQSQFALGDDETTSRILHVWIGYIVILGVLLQIAVGAFKYARLLSASVKTAKWHGKVGRWVYFFGICNVSIAVGSWSGFDAGVQVILYVFLVLITVGTLLLLERFRVESSGGRGDFQRIPIGEPPAA